jgi:hypothetical protein
VEAELFEQFEAVDDPAPAAAAPHFGAAEFHGEDAAALEADIADLDLFAGELLAGGGVDDGGAGLAAEEERGRVGFGVAADEQDALALFGHHVAEIGEREGFADAALAVDRDDLGLFRGFGGDDVGEVLVRFGAEAGVEILEVGDVEGHAVAFQSRIILRQAGSEKAVS